MKIKKSGIVGGVVALMLCVAVYLNWSYSKPEEGLTAASDYPAEKTLGEAKLVDATQKDPTTTQEDPASTEGEGSKTETKDGEGETAGAYFERARLQRTRARDESLRSLREVAENDQLEEATREKAGEMLNMVAASALREARIENLILAKGFQDAVVSISEDSVSVIVKPAEGNLQQIDVAKLRDIVLSEVAISADEVKIVEAQ